MTLYLFLFLACKIVLFLDWLLKPSQVSFLNETENTSWLMWGFQGLMKEERLSAWLNQCVFSLLPSNMLGD